MLGVGVLIHMTLKKKFSFSKKSFTFLFKNYTLDCYLGER
jgi:hypothetical protein